MNRPHAHTRQSAQLMYHAVAQPAVQAVLAQVGVDTTLIDHGAHLITWTEQQIDHYAQAQQAQLTATTAFNDLLMCVYPVYLRQLHQARVVITDVGAQYALGLWGKRATMHTTRLDQMQRFYAAALADTSISTMLARSQITLEQLQHMQTELEKLAFKQLVMQTTRTQLHHALHEKQAALKELQSWINVIRERAQDALSLNPAWQSILEPILQAAQHAHLYLLQQLHMYTQSVAA